MRNRREHLINVWYVVAAVIALEKTARHFAVRATAFGWFRHFAPSQGPGTGRG
jgi:hypothetical protein